MSQLYSPDWYEQIDKGSARSAHAVAPEILEMLPDTERVIDVGCGTGAWGAAFQALGCTVLGIDGPWSPGAEAIPFGIVDLAEPIVLEWPADLAVSLEVAEHLPPERAAGFVYELCSFAPAVLFSAAQPGQEGQGHVNCQPPQYWVDLFAANGYSCQDVRPLFWDDLSIEPWYRANLLLFHRTGSHSPSHVAVRTPDDLWFAPGKRPA